MVKITIKEALESFGFSDKQIEIYLASLELGTATANEISNKADLNRSTTYDLLKEFIEKGIAAKITRNKTTNFEVISPQKLISQLDDKKHKIKEVLPELELLQKKTVEKPTVKVFEGQAGVKTILEDILQTGGRNDVISTSKIFKTFGYYFPHYLKRKKRLNVSSRVIQEESLETNKLKKRDKLENRETRSLKNWDINSVTFIYKNKVAIIKLRKSEIIAVLIKDKTLADDQRKIFERLWNQAK